MDAPVANSRLPAQRIDAQGRTRIDTRSIVLLAGPLVANSAVQAVLNLTDTWFVGRLSTTATAAMGAIYWLVFCAIMLLGGLGMAVQTFAAQAHGAGRYRRAGQAAWSGVVASLLSLPAFFAIAWLGKPLFALLDLDAEVQRLALDYWWPRLVIGGPLALVAWSLTGFFNGIGRSRVTLVVTLVTALANVPFNQWFIFDLGLGMAGSAWGTVAAQAFGIAVACALLLGPRMRARYATHLTWRHPRIRRQFTLGVRWDSPRPPTCSDSRCSS